MSTANKTKGVNYYYSPSPIFETLNPDFPRFLKAENC